MARWYLVIGEVVFVSVVLVMAWLMFHQKISIPGAVRTSVTLADDTQAQVYIKKDETGGLQYYVWHPGSGEDKISADDLTQRLYQNGAHSGLALFGAGSSSSTVLFWLGVGFFGQLLFTGRMLVQWLASEREGTSVVPPMFWWMSLIGSILLLAYFLWRRDPIGLLGQAFGSFVYLRNIIWIMEGRRLGPAVAAEDGDAVVQK